MSFKKESLSDVRLHVAARAGDLATLRHLLDSGKVHPDCKDKDGTTPLMIAAANGHFDCCQELIGQGANPALRRKTGAGSLFLAAQGGFVDIVQLLIRTRAPVNAQCTDGGTALMVAAQQGYADVCLELMNNGADINRKMKDGATCLFLAAQNGQAKVVSLILTKASKAEKDSLVDVRSSSLVNCRRRDGATPLWMAAQMGYDNIVRLLLRAGADPSINRNDGQSPLMKACQKGHDGVVRELLQWSPILAHFQNGENPLCAAVLARNTSIVQMLLKAGANPDLPSNGSSSSPNALARQHNLWKIVKLFDAYKMPRLPNA